MPRTQETRVVSAQLLNVRADKETGEGTIELRLEDGHELQVVLGPGGLFALHQLIVHERDEGRVAFHPQRETE